MHTNLISALVHRLTLSRSMSKSMPDIFPQFKSFFTWQILTLQWNKNFRLMLFFYECHITAVQSSVMSIERLVVFNSYCHFFKYKYNILCTLILFFWNRFVPLPFKCTLSRSKCRIATWVLARGWSLSSSRSCFSYWRCDYLTQHLQAWQCAGTECVKHSHFPSYVSTGPWWPMPRWERWLICHQLMPGLLPGHALALIWHCKQRKLHKASTLQDALSWAEQIKGVIMPRGRTQAPGLIWLANCACTDSQPALGWP